MCVPQTAAGGLLPGPSAPHAPPHLILHHHLAWDPFPPGSQSPPLPASHLERGNEQPWRGALEPLGCVQFRTLHVMDSRADRPALQGRVCPLAAPLISSCGRATLCLLGILSSILSSTFYGVEITLQN